MRHLQEGSLLGLWSTCVKGSSIWGSPPCMVAQLTRVSLSWLSHYRGAGADLTSKFWTKEHVKTTRLSRNGREGSGNTTTTRPDELSLIRAALTKYYKLRDL